MIIMALVSCKEPGVGPGDSKPLDDAGYIHFDSPAVGQKNIYVHFYAKAYWEPTPSPITYTNDTITWEIVKQIDRNTFTIQEKLSGLFFNKDGINNSVREYTLVKDDNKILIYGPYNLTNYLLGYKDSLTVTLNNDMEISHTAWRIENTTNSGKLNGYITNYDIKGINYDRLDVYSDLSPMSYDGIGLTYSYNGKFGFTRNYYINPWIGEVNGFDLVRDSKKQTDKPIELTNTHWKLKNVVFKDGTKKSIDELSKGNSDPNFEDNFTLNFNPHNDANGKAGCNNFSGEYKIDKNSLTIKITGPITQIWCPFSTDYIETLNTSLSFKSDGDGLVINVDNQQYSGLEYERVREDTPIEIKLNNTNWRLKSLQKSNGDIIPIEKIADNKPDGINFSVFSLAFLDMQNIVGFSGCNKFVGTYKSDKEKLHIEIQFSTEVACKFSSDFQYLVAHSRAYTADKNRLIIYIESNNFNSLEFERMN